MGAFTRGIECFDNSSFINEEGGYLELRQALISLFNTATFVNTGGVYKEYQFLENQVHDRFEGKAGVVESETSDLYSGVFNIGTNEGVFIPDLIHYIPEQGRFINTPLDIGSDPSNNTRIKVASDWKLNGVTVANYDQANNELRIDSTDLLMDGDTLDFNVNIFLANGTTLVRTHQADVIVSIGTAPDTCRIANYTPEIYQTGAGFFDLDVPESTAANPLTYQWTAPNGFTSNVPDIIGLIPGVYTFTATNTAGDEVCVIQESIELRTDDFDDNFCVVTSLSQHKWDGGISEVEQPDGSTQIVLLGDGISWHDPLNWEDDRLPKPSEWAAMPTNLHPLAAGNEHVEVHQNVDVIQTTIEELTVKSGASMVAVCLLGAGTLNNQGEIASLKNKVDVFGSLTNQGTIRGNALSTTDLEGGQSVNNGLIDLEHLVTDGFIPTVFYGEKFINNGSIIIRNAINIGMSCGTFVNNSTIDIIDTKSFGLHSIANLLTNKSGARINVSTSLEGDATAMAVLGPGILRNEGEIHIEKACVGIEHDNGKTIENKGLITINNIQPVGGKLSRAIFLKAPLKNTGTIHIGTKDGLNLEANPIQGQGLMSTHFLNQFADDDLNPLFDNSGLITINNVVSNGIPNNDGEINPPGAAWQAHLSGFTNGIYKNSGTVAIGRVGNIAGDGLRLINAGRSTTFNTRFDFFNLDLGIIEIDNCGGNGILFKQAKFFSTATSNIEDNSLDGQLVRMQNKGRISIGLNSGLIGKSGICLDKGTISSDTRNELVNEGILNIGSPLGTINGNGLEALYGRFENHQKGEMCIQNISSSNFPNEGNGILAEGNNAEVVNNGKALITNTSATGVFLRAGSSLKNEEDGELEIDNALSNNIFTQLGSMLMNEGKILSKKMNNTFPAQVLVGHTENRGSFESEVPNNQTGTQFFNNMINEEGGRFKEQGDIFVQTGVTVTNRKRSLIDVRGTNTGASIAGTVSNEDRSVFNDFNGIYDFLSNFSFDNKSVGVQPVQVEQQGEADLSNIVPNNTTEIETTTIKEQGDDSNTIGFVTDTGVIKFFEGGNNPVGTYVGEFPIKYEGSDVAHIVDVFFQIIASSSTNCSINTSKTDESFDGAADGSVDAILATTFAPSFSINWFGPDGFTANTEDIASLAAGAYMIQVTDSSTGQTCQKVVDIEITNEIACNLVRANDVTCPGESDGSIDVQISGGSGSFNLTWTGSNGFSSAQANLSGLKAGSYNLIATDANDSNVSCNLAVTLDEGDCSNNSGLICQLDDILDESCPGDSDGAVEVSVSGGSGTYRFHWSSVDGFVDNDNEDISNLPPDTYLLHVTDMNNPAFTCSVQAAVGLDVICTELGLDITIFLQGPLNTSTGLMSNALQTSNTLPVSDPYANTGESNLLNPNVIADANVLNNNDIVDWVIVELRSDETTIAARKVGLLRTDGKIIDPETGGAMTFAGGGLSAGDYFVAVKHRNHLGVMTEQAVTITAL